MIILHHGDCLEIMKSIPDKSIDLVLTDPPYGKTACKWDSIIHFDLMWKELKRIRKDNTAICIFGIEPFSSKLRMSNIKEFKYDWIWEKSNPSGFVNAKLAPIKSIELISIFSDSSATNGAKKNMFYYPQGLKKYNKIVNGIRKKCSDGQYGGRLSHKKEHLQEYTNYPKQILHYSNDKNRFHPTQKPVALLEYLIKTYTLEGETVLDFTMGSGSTGVACKNLNRRFIGIEKDDKYFQIAKDRIEKHIVTSI